MSNLMIYKYPLQIEDEQIVEMPQGAVILSVINQNDQICVYALVDAGSDFSAKRLFRIFGTGSPVDSAAGFNFIGTVPAHGGAMVWHVFVDVKGGV